MIFEYTYAGPEQGFLAISNLFPEPFIGLLITVSATLGFVFFWRKLQNQNNQRQGESLSCLTLLICSIAILGVYFFSLRWVDEVYVNLEHPYNLFHWGLFSFSPQRMVDGTVEFLYYWLLTPFAFNQITLVYGAVFLGFAICWLHLFLVWRILLRNHPLIQFALLLAFTLATPLIFVFSTGFGNGLVSLLLLACFTYQLNGGSDRALFCCMFFPLIRPDAILYSFAVIAVETWRQGKVPFKNLLGSIVALLTYLTLFRLFYGHWIPTPISFKSFKPSMIAMIGWDDVGQELLSWIIHPFHILFLVLLWASFRWFSSPKIQYLRLYTLPLGLIFFFYLFTTAALVRYEVQVSRYYVGFELLTVLFPILFLAELVIDATIRRGKGFRILDVLQSPTGKTRANLACLLSVMGYTAAALITYLPLRETPSVASRTGFLGYAGQVTDAVVPADWSVSATEMNTFGFMMPNREIIDLWGYTNPAIAHSSTCSEVKVRNNPDLFLQIQPDVFWWWRIRRDRTDYEVLLQRLNLSKQFNQLGNMLEVLRQYDLFVLIDRHFRVGLLVKNTRQAEFLERLSQKNYIQINRRAYDYEKFGSLYNDQKLVQFFCG